MFFSYIASLHQGGIHFTLRWTRNQSLEGGVESTPSRFMLQTLDICTGLMDHLTPMQTLPLLMFAIQLFECQLREFSGASRQFPLVDGFLYSHHLIA